MTTMITIIISVLGGLLVNVLWKYFFDSYRLSHEIGMPQIIPTSDGDYRVQKLIIKNDGHKTIHNLCVEMSQESIDACHIHISHPESDFRNTTLNNIFQIKMDRLLPSERSEITVSALANRFDRLDLKSVKSNEISSNTKLQEQKKTIVTNSEQLQTILGMSIGIITSFYILKNYNILSRDGSFILKRDLEINWGVSTLKKEYVKKEEIPFYINVKNDHKEPIYEAFVNFEPLGYDLDYSDKYMKIGRLDGEKKVSLKHKIPNKFPTGKNFINYSLFYKTVDKNYFKQKQIEVEITD